jgi:dephospho-CoA kinase
VSGDEARVGSTAETGAASHASAGAARRALRIGLTGPIGCGKSTVAGWLAARGASVIDADEIARAVTAPGKPAHDAILARFGDAVRAPDGTLDRASLARLVFADPAALGDLEAIVHPVVRPRILEAIAAADARGTRAVVIEAIKLVEGGLAELCDEVWLVECGPATQRRRLAGRGMDRAEARRRIAAQGDLVARLRPHATRVVRTDGHPDNVSRDAQNLLEVALAERGTEPTG